MTLSHITDTSCKPDRGSIIAAQSALACSKLTIETLEQGVNYVRS